jgi:predicted AAA+ superfamily ATPase
MTDISRMLLHREEQVRTLEGLLRRHPVVALVGARQVGKTTLAKLIQRDWNGPVHHFDLEDPADLSKLSDPMLALADRSGLIVLDEIHRRPDIFPVLRVLVDRGRPRRRFLVLGSASPDLLRQGSESLAGRIVYHELGGFSLDEVGAAAMGKLWLRGGFPRSFLARTNAASLEWRLAFVRTFLERDLPQFGIRVPSATLHRFWTMLAHDHGNVFNASELGRSFGVADTTVRSYVDLLCGTFVARQLLPWHENLGKRQIRSPKVYLADTGLLHALLAVESVRHLEGHPKVGASWESFAMEIVIQRLGARREECFFWGTHAGAELDLLVVRGRRRLGFEFKRTTTPAVTRSIHVAQADLRPDRVDVVHAGADTYPLADGVRAVALRRALKDIGPLS